MKLKLEVEDLEFLWECLRTRGTAYTMLTLVRRRPLGIWFVEYYGYPNFAGQPLLWVFRSAGICSSTPHCYTFTLAHQHRQWQVQCRQKAAKTWLLIMHCPLSLLQAERQLLQDSVTKLKTQGFQPSLSPRST